jgi:hypothetical protein
MAASEFVKLSRQLKGSWLHNISFRVVVAYLFYRFITASIPKKVDFMHVNSFLLKENYIAFSVAIFITLSACLFGPFPQASSQAEPNTSTEPNSSIQPMDSNSAAGQDSFAPILLAPIDAVGDNVYFVWSTNKTGNFEVFFTSSPDNGETIQDATNLSNSSEAASLDVSLKAEGDNVYVSWWENYANGSRIPVYVASDDNGRTFGEKVILSESIK